MFGLGKKKEKIIAEGKETSKEGDLFIQSDIKTENIRTMPEKFLSHKLAGKKDRWLIYVIILIVLAIMIVAAIILFNRLIEANKEEPNVNQNTNAITNINQNANQNTNINQNTNTSTKIDELSKTLLTRDELGANYSQYEESEIEVDTAEVSDITAARAQKWFTYEEAGKDNIAIYQATYEVDSQSDALTIFEINKEKNNRVVKNNEGNLQDHTKVGEDSYLFLNKDLSVIELSFYWQYIYATTRIEIRQGVLTEWDEIESWSEQFISKIKQYDKDRPPVNKNTNSNQNTNTNTNSNANINTNTNTNSNINVNPPTSSSDQDDDQLTDIEEIMFGTEVAKPDTDGDSYLDGAELISGYNPLTGSGAKIEGSGLVKVYANQLFNYRVLYPTNWIVQTSSYDGSSVVFSADTSEFIEVLIEDNPDRLSPKQWYLSLSSGIDPEQVETIVVRGLVGVKSLDQMTVYLGKENVIYVISYNIGNRDEASFISTYKMFINSFTLTGEPVGTNTNSNANEKTNLNENININEEEETEENLNTAIETGLINDNNYFLE